MSPELSKTVKRYLNLKKKLNLELGKEYFPIIEEAVKNKDESKLRMLLNEIPEALSFKIRVYQALVGIK